MSYNISSQKVKKLENFKIPIASLYDKCKRDDWKPKQPEIKNVETNLVSIEFGCEQHITGILKEGILSVTEFDFTGEGSGVAMDYVLENALKDSSGLLQAILVWEGGDTIESFKVENGIITQTDIEL
jgi:hypothetical protein